ncbi:hypothetical protein Scep_005271 [Stephania cephalantha]|uniref:Glycosyltransferase n=1 Tax=Stephania cephalantha TaxID=152367 RepID=A0AAP0KTZ5_9MAGN
MAPLLESQLHFILLPFMAQGHMIPMIEIAQLLARRSVIATIITTHQNMLRHKAVLDRAMASGLPIRLLQLHFPSREVGLPEGCENADTVPSLDLFPNFFQAIDMLKFQLEESLAEIVPKPSCLIYDMFFPWASEVATKFDIPRIVFHGMSCFSHLCHHILRNAEVMERVESEYEPFFIPNLPRPIEITKNKLPGTLKKSNQLAGRIDRMVEAEESAYGMLINSFEELEPEYVKLYREARRGNVWCIGPLSLSNKNESDIVERGDKASIDKNKCLEWLDSREPNSVMYVCLGSMCRLTAKQLIEIGMALEASEQSFVWVIRSDDKRYRELESWLDREGYEERNKERGLVIRGWAPQVMILSHRSVGGFLTHCGWNSTLEALCAGVPMLTWPMFAEQFLNEKMIVEVLMVGYSLGVDAAIEWGEIEKITVKKEEIERGVRRLMDKSTGEYEEMKRRVEEIKEMGERALKEGGSSHLNLTSLIDDVRNQVSM